MKEGDNIGAPVKRNAALKTQGGGGKEPVYTLKLKGKANQ